MEREVNQQTTIDPKGAKQAHLGDKVLGFFGLGASDSEQEERRQPVSAADSETKGSIEINSRLLYAIRDFVFENELSVTPQSLQLAYAVCSGENELLARKVQERRLSGSRVTMDWLARSVSQQETNFAEREAEIHALSEQLEQSIGLFTVTTRKAKNAATECNRDIESQVADPSSIEDLTGVAQAILASTKKMENEMIRSEREAGKLRKELAKAKRAAEIDHLTGLPNRRSFENFFEKSYKDAQAKISPLSVAFCDIDHFKNVNDTHGHDTGDRVIQAIANVLKQASNEDCHVARHGGEEFVMLFRGISLDEAQERLDQARVTLENKRFRNRDSDISMGTITFSAGIADVFAFPDRHEALRAADEALYAAKENGRNRIERAGTPSS